MYYRLTEDVALRAWKFVNGAMYLRLLPMPLQVDREIFELLQQCDGEHDLEESPALIDLAARGCIEPCEQGVHPSEWSRFKRYDHRFVPAMNLMLTGKCNFNCRHCFNAADNAAIMTEWDFDELLDLLDQASDCGMHSITLTGGEPMLHPRFMDVVHAIYERNMVLEKLTTNGWYLTEETLNEFRTLGCNPQIKISFDGVGTHNWMRKHPSAEESALRALRLCSDKGFRTMAQVQVHRGNLDRMHETLAVLEDAGVSSARLIRTNETVRWAQNAPNGSLSLEEYFESMLDLAEEYMRCDHAMEVVMWRYLVLDARNKCYSLVMQRQADGVYRPTAPVCLGNRTMMAVSSDGEVLPCLQMGGFLKAYGQRFDSLKERRLVEILRGGTWLDNVCMNHYHLRKNNAECDKCEWFGLCGGGCRALGLLFSVEDGGAPNFSGSDPLACLFYKGGWYDRVRDRLRDYKLIG